MMDYYSIISNSYNELYGEEQLKKIKLILESNAIKAEDKILDVGCGTAVYSNLFKNYTGIDNARKMLKHPSCVLGNAEDLPFPDHSFDVVMSITAIHTFEDSEKALREMKRVAKNKVIISVLKRSPKSFYIKSLIKKYFKVIFLEEEKDIIFISK